MVLTETKGQRVLADDLGEAACVYRAGDVKTLASKLRLWANDKAALLQSRHGAWEAAQRRWHWEHPLERGVLLEAVKQGLE